MDAKENVIRLIADKHISQEALKLLTGVGEILTPEKRIEALEQKIAEQEKKVNELGEALNIKFRSPYGSCP